ncbi:MAG: HEAT repeat domain-containing protein [Planctomycetaceae bacterium]|nr:HEAT repeat domain-containing protein [Planctomycetaceae bacterium]
MFVMRYGLLLVLLAGCQSATEPVAKPSQPAGQGGQKEATAPVRSLAAPVFSSSPAATDSAATVRSASPAAAPVVDLNPEAVSALQTMTTTGVNAADWEAAQQRLLDLGTEAVPVLVQGLASAESIEREAAVTTLVLLGPDAVTLAQAPLSAALRDPSQFVRANAAAALMQIPEGTEQAVPILVDLLSASDSGLRQMAAMNLQMQPQALVPELPAISAALRRETSPEVVVPLLELVQAMGPSAAASLPLVQQLATSGDESVRDLAVATAAALQGEVRQVQAEVPGIE